MAEEFKGCLDLAKFMIDTLGFTDDVSYRFSKWDENDKEKYIGDKEDWECTQNMMRDILNDLQVPYTEADGEAAFYGPKLDIQIRNVYGKEDTLVTIQIDFQLAERFGMQYMDSDGLKKYPVVIHRTSIGCYERTLALLIEKYAGALPTWMAPVQVKVLPITDRTADASVEIQKSLEQYGIRVETDTAQREDRLQDPRGADAEDSVYARHRRQGDRAGSVAVRSRKSGDMGTMPVDDFARILDEEVREKRR